MNIFVVVNNPREWPFHFTGAQVISAQAYLTDPQYSDLDNARVFNLCRSYRYQSIGYYVSLLAAARGHKPIPSVTTIQDLKSPTVARVFSEDVEEDLDQSLAHVKEPSLTLDIFFGRTSARRCEGIARALYSLFQAPFLRASLQRDDEGWHVQSIRALAESEIAPAQREFVAEVATDFFTRGRFHVKRRTLPRYSMAILFDPSETKSPSDPVAIDRFERAAGKLGIEVEIIGRDDFARIAEYDALFIRQTTSVMHHTYRFARRAEAEGLVVVDDSLSILRCANKVYLAELMECHDIRTPKTVIVHRDNVERLIPELGLPCVLKQPDSSFSEGVVKVDNATELRAEVERLLEKSDLIIAQEFIATPFDWRIGIFDRRPLYACKYYMARRHWQIISRENGTPVEGRHETMPVELAPRQVVSTALRVANLIGDGLYGVDLKQVGRQIYVIEVNDNPSIEAGVEDEVLKGDLYLRIMEIFLRRLEKHRPAWSR